MALTAAKQKKKFLYRQGVANLRIEGMILDRQQHKLAFAYQQGKISHQELIAKAIEYARSR